MPTLIPSDLTRRRFCALSVVGAGAAAVAGPALALTESSAMRLVDTVVAEINRVIASGKPESAMYVDFQRIFERYADVPIIARYALGADARRASSGQLRAFTDAFTVYISRKYGRRFREFIGGRIEVTGARPARNGQYEVVTVAHLRGEAPFEVSFFVSDQSGRERFFNMYIEGINMLLTERTEIGAMLDKRRGDIDLLIADLRSAG